MLELNGFRFYGCSLLLIYDGDAGVQSHYSRHVRAAHSTIEEEEYESPFDTHRSGQNHKDSRRSRSADMASANPRDKKPKKIRGEVNIRVVDFAHTTTGSDFVPILPGTEDTDGMGKGYETKFEESSGLAMARFPPKYASRPDMGFIFGLKSVCETLEQIWVEAVEDGEVEGMRGVQGIDVPWWHQGEEMLKGVFERAFPGGIEKAEIST